MTVPSFSRIEVRHDTADDLAAAAASLASLSRELQRIAASVTDTRLMRLAAHDAIRDTSSRLRLGATQ
jgi:hypothetical protein